MNLRKKWTEYGMFFPASTIAVIVTGLLWLLFAGAVASTKGDSQTAAIGGSVVILISGVLLGYVIEGLIGLVALSQTENDATDLMRQMPQGFEAQITKLEQTVAEKARELEEEHRTQLALAVRWVNATLDDDGWQWILKQISEKPTKSEHIPAFAAQISALVMTMKRIHQLDTAGTSYQLVLSRVTSDLNRARANTTHSGAEEDATKNWEELVEQIKKLLPGAVTTTSWQTDQNFS